jgi:hypothetical protein
MWWAALAFVGGTLAAGPPAVDVVSPAPGARLAAGGTVWIEWHSGAPLAEQGFQEWEAFLSLDGGRYFGIRLTPHLDIGVRRFPVALPGVASGDVRFLLKLGDERIEWEVAVPGRFELEPDPLPVRWPALGGGEGEAARPGEPGVALWLDGSRSGTDLRVRRAAPEGGVRSPSPGWTGGAASLATASAPPPAPEPQVPSGRSARDTPVRRASAPANASPPLARDPRSLTERCNE